MSIILNEIILSPVINKYSEIILKWLDEPHVREFWDNSPELRDDILNFNNRRKTSSNYYNGIFSYWIGSIDDEPYCLLMTCQYEQFSSIFDIHKQYLSKTGKTYGIDFCIGNTKFLGKGLSVPTLNTFIDFFQKQIDKNADTFFIEPCDDNLRAIHVYKKAGFTHVGNFIADLGYFEGCNSLLMVKTINNHGQNNYD